MFTKDVGRFGILAGIQYNTRSPPLGLFCSCLPSRATSETHEAARPASSGRTKNRNSHFQAIPQTPLRPFLVRPVCLPAATLFGRRLQSSNAPHCQ